MPSKMRAPNAASLHGDRSVKEQIWVSVLTKAKLRCRAAVQATTSADQAEVLGMHRTQSKGTKKLYKLYLLGCTECNLRNIEAFEEEVQMLSLYRQF